MPSFYQRWIIQIFQVNLVYKEIIKKFVGIYLVKLVFIEVDKLKTSKAAFNPIRT